MGRLKPEEVNNQKVTDRTAPSFHNNCALVCFFVFWNTSSSNCEQAYLGMIPSDVCQQLVDEATHQSSGGVDSSYELGDHLQGQKSCFRTVIFVYM